MADHVALTVDASSLLSALALLGDRAVPYLKGAARDSANAVQRTARGIVARRTGETAEGIVVREDFTGEGYIVATADVLPGEVVRARQVLAQRSRNIRRRVTARYYQGEHVGLWLEGGTVQGAPRSHSSAPRPFLNPAARLEEGPHRRRVAAAIDTALGDAGLRG